MAFLCDAETAPSCLQVLSKRVVTRLRALIILPTRDLVMQVRETLDSLSRGTGLKVGYVREMYADIP